MMVGHYWKINFMKALMINKILEIILLLSLITTGVIVLIFVIRDSINKDDDTNSEV